RLHPVDHLPARVRESHRRAAVDAGRGGAGDLGKEHLLRRFAADRGDCEVRGAWDAAGQRLPRHPSGRAGQHKRLVKVISLPAALKPTSSMNVRTGGRPRRLEFARLAGSVGSGRLETSKPGPSSRTTKTTSRHDSRAVRWTRRSRYGASPRRRSARFQYGLGSGSSRRSELTSRLPCSMAFASTSRRAVPTRISPFLSMASICAIWLWRLAISFLTCERSLPSTKR